MYVFDSFLENTSEVRSAEACGGYLSYATSWSSIHSYLRSSVQSSTQLTTCSKLRRWKPKRDSLSSSILVGEETSGGSEEGKSAFLASFSSFRRFDFLGENLSKRNNCFYSHWLLSDLLFQNVRNSSISWNGCPKNYILKKKGSTSNCP